MTHEEDSLDEEESVPEDQVEGADEGKVVIPQDATVVIEKNDRSVRELFTWHNEHELNLHPDWQRHYVWDKKRASNLIESIFMGIPIPVIYLSQTPEGKFEVIDGVQRLTSVFRFLSDEFSLVGLQSFTELEGKRFSKLPEERQRQIRNYTFRTFELAKNTSADLLFLIFERLNTGGLRLNEAEIRNCIFRGTLNNAIKKMAEGQDFRQCLNVKNLEKRMEDRGLVLRFLAFHQRNYRTATNGLKDFLNKFFQENRNASEDTIRDFEKRFGHAMRCAKTVFGDAGFRLRKKYGRGSGEWTSRPNASVYQVIATSFVDKDHGLITRHADAILEEYMDILEDQQWIDAVTRSTGDQSNIRYAFETWNKRLDTLLASFPSNASERTRLFSKQLKAELFEQNRTCAICNQEISLMNDAAVDHVEQYWLGGATIPENARLAHRSCNLRRSRGDGQIA
jgi:Protein of unknown function DUF262/HNH endonuclease